MYQCLPLVMGRPGTEALLMGCSICFHSEARVYMAAGARQETSALDKGHPFAGER